MLFLSSWKEKWPRSKIIIGTCTLYSNMMTIVSFVQADILEETFWFKVLQDVFICSLEFSYWRLSEDLQDHCTMDVQSVFYKATSSFPIIQDGTDGTTNWVSKYHWEKDEEQGTDQERSGQDKNRLCKDICIMARGPTIKHLPQAVYLLCIPGAAKLSTTNPTSASTRPFN